jgi:2'-5' RNA ligase
MTTTPPPPHTLQARYDAMWMNAYPAVRAGDVDCDARLAAGLDAHPDPRRGLTLIARPGPALAARFGAVLDRLGAIDGRQYRHPKADLHLTVLSLFTVGDGYAPALARLDDYRAAVRAAVAGIAAFDIDFRGVTLSRGAVLAQGFPEGPMLELLRERLRAALRERGLDATLDGRYRLVTAHVTLLRFAAPLAESARFGRALEGMRGEALGMLRVEEVQLVENDWYMTGASVRRIETLRLD